MTGEQPKSFNISDWIRRILIYQKYHRLMGLLFCLGLLSGVVYYIYSSPVYQSRALVRVDGLQTSSDNTGQQRLDPSVIPHVVVSEFRSQVLMVEAAKRLGFAGPGSSFEGVRGSVIPKLSVRMLDNNTIQVEVFSYYPEVVRKFPEAMIAQYREDRQKQASEYRSAAIDSYLAELDDLRAKLEEKLKSRLSYEKEGELAEVQLRQRQLSQVPVKLELARFKLAEVRSVLQTLDEQGDRLGVTGRLSLVSSYRATGSAEVGRLVRNPGNKDILPTAVVEDLPGEREAGNVVVQPEMVDGMEPWRALEKEKRLVQREMERLSETHLPGHPSMINLENRLKNIEDELTAELEIATTRLRLEEETLKDDIASLEAQMADYYAVTEELDRRQLDYQLLQSGNLNWEEAYESIAKDVSRFESVSDREPFRIQLAGFLTLRDEDPISPNKFKLALMGVVLGLGLAFSVPFGLELLNDRSSTIADLERLTGLNGIGIVPLTSTELLEEIVRSPKIGADVPNYLLENFRVIRSNIILHPGRQNKSQVIMVTSARPGEGKSTGAANIAWSFYSMGERTLLIDADLRRGRVHELIGLDNSTGLTNLFSGQVREEDVIKETPVENLWAIPRGPVITGTTEILCGAGFDVMIERWRKTYDRIVIDTPPVLGLSETASLQRVVDGVVLVVQSEKTIRKDVADAVTLLRKSGAHIYGFVLNRVDLSKTYNYFNYYYYSAQYYDSFLPEEEPTSKRKTSSSVNSLSGKAL